MDVNIEKVPLHWDTKGRILKWAKGSKPVKNIEGKQAFSWCEASGRVLLWVFTLPSKDWERIPDDELTMKQREFYSFGSAEIEARVRQFSFGKIAEKDDSHLIISLADDLTALEANLRGKDSPWGDPPQAHTPRNRQSMRTFLKFKKRRLRFFGDILYRWIEKRDAVALEDLAKSLREARGLSLTWHAENGIWHHADTFQGTVYRCWRVLWSWSLDNSCLPTKRGLREYVIQEWEAMGHSASTASEFSDALKALGLSKLPNGPRQKLLLPRAKKKQIEK